VKPSFLRHHVARALMYDFQIVLVLCSHRRSKGYIRNKKTSKFSKFWGAIV